MISIVFIYIQPPSLIFFGIYAFTKTRSVQYSCIQGFVMEEQHRLDTPLQG